MRKQYRVESDINSGHNITMNTTGLAYYFCLNVI